MDIDLSLAWQAIGAIAGVIAAATGVAGLAKRKDRHGDDAVARHRTGMSQYVLFLMVGTVGWGVCVVSYVWFFQPFGTYMSMDEHRKIVAVVLAFPAIGLLRLAFLFLPDDTSNGD